MIKAIIFDFDGVIAESTEVKTRAFRKLFENEGEAVVKCVEKYHIENQGVTRFEKFRHIYKEILKRELDDIRYHNLCETFSRLVKDDVIKAPLVNGALDFLKNNNSQYLFFIASATPQEEIEEIISAKGIAPYFKRIYGAPRRKSDIVKYIKKHYVLLSDEIIYVGDALSDFEAARNSMIHFIARVNTGVDVFKDVECDKIKDISELKTIIDRFESLS